MTGCMIIRGICAGPTTVLEQSLPKLSAALRSVKDGFTRDYEAIETKELSEGEHLEVDAPADSTIMAGIVSYNPDLVRLRENLEAVTPQVDYVVVIDNGSTNVDEVTTLCSEFGASLVRNAENQGIAAALNQIFEHCIARLGEGQDEKNLWVLTLDQDSVVMSDLIAMYRDAGGCSLAELLISRRIASLCCFNRDVNYDNSPTKIGSDAKNKEASQIIGRCITSANLVNAAVWREIGGFDESLFIDEVDHNFCYQLREAGYQILRINSVGFLHEIGHSQRKRFLWKNPVVYNHPAWRVYYECRNRVLILRRHPQMAGVYDSPLNLLMFSTKTLLYEDDRRGKLEAILHGIRDGLRG